MRRPVTDTRRSLRNAAGFLGRSRFSLDDPRASAHRCIDAAEHRCIRASVHLCVLDRITPREERDPIDIRFLGNYAGQ